ncbi:Detected protein of unknown function [Hibiscus syriacus]|uniref:Uncharacterized protein n=2 Tax=Hibiscus syriacus TaxID=106335 RepID=A0A6A2XNH3_HIBSY|nr:Detected protein of unknown function [Hibiscus syriacus]
MEATLAKRALFNIPKLLPHGPPGIQSARNITRARLSSAFERAEGSNAVAEGSSDDAPSDSMYETNPSFVTGEGRPPASQASFGADMEKDGIKKAVETAENVGDSAKKTMDGAWRAAKDGAQGIKERVLNDVDEFAEDVAVDEIRKVDQLVDTREYRSIEELKKVD